MTASDGEVGRLLLMPAWADDAVIGVKLVIVWPDNPVHGLPSHGASYVLLDARSGAVRAVLAAEALTQRRTAAVSVLAARRLLPARAERLLVIGAGPVAERLVEAHAASGRFTDVALFARDRGKAAAVVARLDAIGVECRVAADLEQAVRAADMIATATSAISPVLRGAWLTPDAHVDLIGGFTPAMREGDDAVVARARAIWIDTPAALDEAGDLTAPLESAVLSRQAITGTLRDLLATSQRTTGGITLFKAVGLASCDLAAAKLALDGL